MSKLFWKKLGSQMQGRDEIISENCEYTSKLGYSVSDEDKIHPVMYWIPKMHKTTIGHSFIIALNYVVIKLYLVLLNLFFDKQRVFTEKLNSIHPTQNFGFFKMLTPPLKSLNMSTSEKMRNPFQHMILILHTPKFQMALL